MVSLREYQEFMRGSGSDFTQPAFGEPPEQPDGTIVGEIVESSLYGVFDGVSSTANFLSFGYLNLDLAEDVGLEAADSWYGGLAQGIAQFALPWGMVGRVAKAANAFKAGQAATQAAGTALTTGQKVAGAAAKPFAWMAQPATNLKAIQAAKEGKALKALAHTVFDGSKRGAVKGAVVDLVAFGGDDPNLSAILQQYEPLQNPLMEVLATDEDDPEALNRLRNVAEGLLLGGIVDTLVIRGRAVKNFKAAKAAGASDQQAAEVASKRMAEDVKVREEGDKAQRDLEYEQVKDKVVEKPKDFRSVQMEDSVDIEPVEQPKLVGDEIREKFKGLMQVQQFLDNNDLTDYNSLQAYLNDAEETTKDILGAYIQRLQEGTDMDILGANPRDLDVEQKLAAAVDDEFANLLPYLQDTDGLKYFRRAMEDAAGPMFHQARMRSKNIRDIYADALDKAQAKGVDENFLYDTVERVANGSVEIQKAVTELHAASIINKRLGEYLVPLYDSLLKTEPDRLTRQQLAGIGNITKAFLALEKAIFENKTSLGRGLKSLGKMGFELEPLSSIQAKDSFNFVPLKELDDAASGSWDPKRAHEALKGAADLMRSDKVADNAAALIEFMQMPQHKRILGLVQEYHIQALLSGVSTQVVNIIGGATMTFLRPAEQMFGAAILQAEGNVLRNPEKIAQARRVISREARTVGLLMTDFMESFKAIRQSTGLDEFTKGSKIEGPRFSSLVATAANSKNSRLFSPLAGLITLPGNLLDKTDQFFKTWSFRAQMRADIEERLMQNPNMDIQTAKMESEGILKAIMKSKGDTRLRLETMKELRQASVPLMDDPAVDFQREGRQQAGEAMQERAGQPTPVDIEKADNAQKLLKESREFDRFRPYQDNIEIILDAIDHGQRRGLEVTFQDPIIPKDGMAPRSVDTVAHRIQQAANEAPAIKFFLPFIRTPYNIARYGWDRSMGAVLGGASEGISKIRGLPEPPEKTMQQLLKYRYMLRSGDEAAIAQARTNLTLGVGILGSIYSAASHSQSISETHELPLFTGSGPTDPDARKALQEAGWQPHSVLIDGKYYSYGRLDPIASILGIAVDAAEYANESIDKDRTSTFQAVSIGLAVGLAENLTSKTYMQGLANLTDLMSAPATEAKRILGATAGGFVPTIVANANRVIDPQVREIEGVVDRLRSRIPGLSQGLPPRRDLLGEPLSYESPMTSFFAPIRVTEVKDSVVRSEIAKFAYGFSQPTNMRGGVDLLDSKYTDGGQPAYDRFLELSGTVRVGGLNLRQALRKEIQSSGYQRLDPGLDPMGEKSPRIDRLNSIFRQYRSRAWEELQRERPAIRTDSRQYKRDRNRRRRGLSIQ